MESLAANKVLILDKVLTLEGLAADKVLMLEGLAADKGQELLPKLEHDCYFDQNPVLKMNQTFSQELGETANIESHHIAMNSGFEVDQGPETDRPSSCQG